MNRLEQYFARNENTAFRAVVRDVLRAKTGLTVHDLHALVAHYDAGAERWEIALQFPGGDSFVWHSTSRAGCLDLFRLAMEAVREVSRQRGMAR